MSQGDTHNMDERSVVAGYDNGDIKMFDLRKMALRWETNVKNGVSTTMLATVHVGKYCCRFK